MKKLVSMVLVAAMLLVMNAVLAEGLEVQILRGKDTQTETLSLDDIKIGANYTISGYAKVTPVEMMFVDYFAQFNKDANYFKYDRTSPEYSIKYGYDYVFAGEIAGNYSKNMDYYREAKWMDSGLNADFVWLKLDITNLQKKPVKYSEEIYIKAIYDNDYEFGGWLRQINYDYNTICARGLEAVGGNTVVLNPANEEAIDMMYTGTFIIGVTLPNSVIEDENAPLRIEIKLGDNYLTYNIRK